MADYNPSFQNGGNAERGGIQHSSPQKGAKPKPQRIGSVRALAIKQVKKRAPPPSTPQKNVFYVLCFVRIKLFNYLHACTLVRNEGGGGREGGGRWREGGGGRWREGGLFH